MMQVRLGSFCHDGRRLAWAIGGLVAIVASGILDAEAHAETCGHVHVAERGETLRSLAVLYYGDQDRWSSIYYTNQTEIGRNPSILLPGTRLTIPCLDGEGRADPTPLRREGQAQLRCLTGGGYAPFTDRDWLGGGLVTELVNAAFEVSPSPVTFSVSWEDDWSKHLFPLLDDKTFDVGFPWLRPNCEENRDHKRCQNFHFSDQIFEMLVLLFVRAGSDLRFETDSDIEGLTICRPNGYYTHDLDREGRRWLSENRIRLEQPDSVEACFRMLVDGAVDGVTLNEFLGRLTVREMGLNEQVKELPQPISIQGLHVLISKTHPRGTTFLYRFNAGLKALKESDRYNEIVTRHLSVYWDRLAALDRPQPLDDPVEEIEPPPKPAPLAETEPPAETESPKASGSSTASDQPSASQRQGPTETPPPTPGGSLLALLHGQGNGRAEPEPAPIAPPTPSHVRSFLTEPDADQAVRRACAAQRKATQLLRQGKVKDALPHLEDAAAIGLPDAATDLGFVYLEGLGGVARDEAKGLDLLERAAANGSGRAALAVAEAYAAGLGVAPSAETAQLFLVIADALTGAEDPLRPHLDAFLAVFQEKVGRDQRRRYKERGSAWIAEHRSAQPSCEGRP
ncbi:transporter substrate-binding domain-containing protein [uncultured Rhodospira sp.]|uniref:transporter substrate-binding domain-containing protein n=1 Tax=uncultured Rhodospira sp. TaxID=1936189 RepID=UPI0026233D67|nr:transporter substrate-binding domain-containing protein [uncultured Rhodospira sp.]